MSLEGQVALVTGSSRGIGRAIALRLARDGASVAVTYREDRAAALEVVGAVEALGRRSAAWQLDAADPDAVDAVVADVESALGPLDIVVCNVGPFALKPLADTTSDEWRTVMDANLGSVFYLCRSSLVGMRARRRGCIVTIGLAPVHLVRAAPNIAPYAIAKTGVVVLTRSLAAEEAANGIRVNCVSPGLIDNGCLPPEQEAWMRERVPMGRLGRADEVADAVGFLASAQASYISGANLAVSGAWDWEDRTRTTDGQVTDLFAEATP